MRKFIKVPLHCHLVFENLSVVPQIDESRLNQPQRTSYQLSQYTNSQSRSLNHIAKLLPSVPHKISACSVTSAYHYECNEHHTIHEIIVNNSMLIRQLLLNPIHMGNTMTFYTSVKYMSLSLSNQQKQFWMLILEQLCPSLDSHFEHALHNLTSTTNLRLKQIQTLVSFSIRDTVQKTTVQSGSYQILRVTT